jgi:CelD/BcsL family acetyltransferase involved in cellulose biosynthesis
MQSPLAGASAVATNTAARLHVQLFDAPLSPELWETYEAATRSHACTRAFLEHFDRPAGATLALVRRRDTDEVVGAFLLDRDGAASVRLLDRYSAPSAETLGALVEAVLERFSDVTRVRTELLDALEEPRVLGRPVLELRKDDELRVALPETLLEYHRSLAKKFRNDCRYYERRVARELPAASITTVEGGDIPPGWIADVLRLHRERMVAMGTRSALDAHYEEGVVAVARRHGFVTVLRDGDRIYAGLVGVRRGPDAVAWVLGVDGAYARFSPGKLCMLAAIAHLVGRGVRTYRFLLGDALYKRQLGARPVALASYVVLRSWGALRREDVLRVGAKNASLAARRTLAAADALAARALHRHEPLRSFLRRAVRRAAPLLRASRGVASPGALGD